MSEAEAIAKYRVGEKVAVDLVFGAGDYENSSITLRLPGRVVTAKIDEERVFYSVFLFNGSTSLGYNGKLEIGSTTLYELTEAEVFPDFTATVFPTPEEPPEKVVDEGDVPF